MPGTAWARRLWVLVQANTWRTLAGAPAEWASFHSLTRRAVRPASRRRQSTETYGAWAGYRWLAGARSGLRYNERVDLQRQANDLIRAVFTETSSFLEARNIDATDLREDEKQALQTVTNNVTSVIGAVFQGDVAAGGDVNASTLSLVASDR